MNIKFKLDKKHKKSSVTVSQNLKCPLTIEKEKKHFAS